MYIFFILLLLFYMFLHSFLAHDKVKTILYKKLINERYYRFFFVSYATVFFIPILYLYYTGKHTIYFIPNTYIIIIATGLIVFSLWIFYISFKNYNFKEFLGIDRINSKDKIHYQLSTEGINKYVRHPLYSASYTLMAGIFLISPDNYILAACMIIAIYLPIGIIFEEQKLVKEYGDRYKKYQKEVPMLIPKI
ncbi:MAG TPA: isoprenylcysteine carboxylmethyltransferase family protein [Bacteroidetes bacterium]|nr:isoprenylcysteine carboxylmethyltransferase family protein [Bacteroidota bacterium]